METNESAGKKKTADQTESVILGVSGRGWLALIMIATMCVMSAMGREVVDPLRSAVLLTIGFYFGQKKSA